MKKVLTSTLCLLLLMSTSPAALAGPQNGSAERQASDQRLDINAATVDQLQTLPGIGPSIAKRIVEFRDSHGPFERVEDLLLVRGIGEKKFLELRDKVRAGS